jgi:KaiC/GvpD/RAD55 family RecA-like ATPase
MGKPVRLADPPSLLAGREDLLADLHTRLTGGDGPRPRTVALCGFGGAGKTSVALAYAHSHLAEVRVAWQLAAENPTVLADGFGQLAAQLGARDVVDIRDPVVSVHGLLAAFPDEWLLIFDNAPELVHRHSLGWVVAREGAELVGFVNVLWDGLVHAWLQDTMVAVRARGCRYQACRLCPRWR